MGLDQAIDITAEQRKTVLALLERHLPNTTAWVYGSRAKWASRPQSDLDLVVFATPEQNGRVSDFREALEESSLPFRVDLFVWDTVPEQFRKHIKQDHVVLAEREEQAAAGEWCATTIGEVVTLQRGFDLPKTERKPGNYPVIASTGATGTHNEAVVRGPGVVIGRSGSLGGGQFIKHDFWPLNTTLWVKDFKGNDRRFCYFLLKSLDLAQFNVGSGVPTLNRNHVHPLPVRLPPPTEQRAIAHILGTLDDKIELNRRMNETLEAMARALFKSWFVDFDPVRAKMAGRDTGLPQHLADLFPDRLVASELGLIPEGWEISPVGEEVDVVGGATPSTKESAYWNDGHHHWATPKDLSNLLVPVLLDTDRKITDAGVKKITSGLLPVGTVLLSSRAPIGYLAIAAVPTAINQGFIAMICEKRLPNLYVLFWCYETLDHIKGIAGGSTFAEINKKAFRPIPILVSPAEALAAYEGSAHLLYDRIVANMKESVLLISLRNTLLPKLVSGELRVKSMSEVRGEHR